MLPWVRDAYTRLGQSAVDSLGLDLLAGSSGHSGGAGNVNTPDAYASGVSSAPPGWAWVGEQEPELIRMRGGETVLPAEISREFAILTAYGNEVAAYANGTDNAAAEAMRLMEINDAAYAVYNNNAVYNNAAYADAPETVVSAVEAVPSPRSGGGSAPAPVNVEVNFHIEGNAAPETVDTLRAYEDELVEKIRTVIKQEREDAAIGYWD